MYCCKSEQPHRTTTKGIWSCNALSVKKVHPHSTIINNSVNFKFTHIPYVEVPCFKGNLKTLFIRRIRTDGRIKTPSVNAPDKQIKITCLLRNRRSLDHIQGVRLHDSFLHLCSRGIIWETLSRYGRLLDIAVLMRSNGHPARKPQCDDRGRNVLRGLILKKSSYLSEGGRSYLLTN